MKKMKNIQLSRETLRDLSARSLGNAAAAFSDPTICEICTHAPNCAQT
jgi:hypothetical protein